MSGTSRGEVPRRTILVYRDRIVPRSEAQFLRRLYIGFERLAPVWVGRYRAAGLDELGADPLLLGRDSWRGVVEREAFKHFGMLPRTPDLAALRPLLVHAHFGRGGTLALPIARALRIPLVVTFHGGDAAKDAHYRWGGLPSVFRRRLTSLQREAALFFCVSEFVRDTLLSRGFPPEKLLLHRYGVELDGSDPGGDPGSNPEGQPVLFAGRFVEKKGIAVLLDALGRIEPATRPRLVLAGDGPIADQLKDRAALLGNVDFPGWLPHPELRQRMRGALAVCVPSLAAADGDAEGLPNIVIEAMAAGVPVVGSRHAGIPEAVEHERTGLLVPPGDPQALADALQRLVEEPGLRQRLGAAARVAAAERFSAIEQSRRLETILERVIDGAAARC